MWHGARSGKYCDVFLGPLLRVMCGMVRCPDKGEKPYEDLLFVGLLLLHQKLHRFSRITPLMPKKQLTWPWIGLAFLSFLHLVTQSALTAILPSSCAFSISISFQKLLNSFFIIIFCLIFKTLKMTRPVCHFWSFDIYTWQILLCKA